MSTLDKASRLAAEKTAKEKEKRQRTARLDPKFPYRVIALDIAFFGVTADPIENRVK